MRSASMAAFLMLLACGAGCEIPAQTFWSPDGARAAYIPSSGSQAQAIIIDATGAIVDTLGRSTGGCAWSADSRTLYFAVGSGSRARGSPSRVLTQWLPPKLHYEQPATRPAKDEPDAFGQVVVSAWRDGRREELFRLDEGWAVWYMLVSPDGEWLAITGQDLGAEEEEERNYVSVMVFNLKTRRLRLVSVGLSWAMAFTGPATLAYIQPLGWSGRRHPLPVGEVVETTLDENAAALSRRRLATVPADSPWLEPLGEDLLLTTRPLILPAAPPEPEEQDRPYRLYRYMRSTGTVAPLADEVGALFRPGPDRRLIMLQKLRRDDGEWRSELAVLDLSSGRTHALCDLPQKMQPHTAGHTPLAAYPAWRTSTEISFLGEPAPAGKDDSDKRKTFDLALYRLTDRFEVKLLRVLSSGWPAELRPSAPRGSAGLK